MADGSVVFTIDADDKKAQKKLDQIKGAIRKLEEETAIKNLKKTRLEQELANAGAAADEAKAKLEELKNAGAGNEAVKEQEQRVRELDKAFDKAASAVEKIDSELADNSDAMTVLKEESAQYEQRLIGVAEAAARAAQYQKEQEAEAAARAKPVEEQVDDAFPQLAKAEEAMNRVRATFAELKQSIGTGLKGILVAPFQLLGAAVQRIPGLLKGAFNVGKKAVVTFGKGVVGAAKNLNVFSRVANAVGPTLKRLGSMITRTFVFNVVTKGLRSLRSTIGDFLSQNTELQAAVNRTKAALTTAFQPIYQAVVPALTAMMNALTRVISAVARFTAMLSGTTAKSAQQNAKALTAQADATEKAGGAAEDAAKQMAGFDEINQLSDSSGGGGAAAEGFDIDYDDSQIESWGQAFSDALDRILEKVKKLPEVFTAAAEKINGFFKKLLEMFTFPGLREKVAQLGRDLAEALNGLVAQIDWYTIGAALGAGLQLAISFLVGFIYSFDWIQLGGAIAEMINGLVSQIDWYEFGQLLWSGFKIGIETLVGFLLNLDMAQLAQAASNIVIGFFDSMAETIRNIEWKEIGKQIITFIANIDWIGIAKSVISTAGGLASGLLEMVQGALASVDWQGLWPKLRDGILEIITSVDWAGLAESLWTMLGTAIGAAIAFVWGFIKDAWEEVVTWWTEHTNEDGQLVIDGLLVGILNKIKGIGTWIKENIFLPFINGFKAAFGIASPSTVMAEMGGYLLEGLFKGLGNVGTKIKEFGSDIISGVKSVLGIASPSKEFEEIGEYSMAGLTKGFDSLPQITKQFKAEIAVMQGVADDFAKDTLALIETVYKALEDALKKALQITRSTTSQMTAMFRNMAAQSISAIQSIINQLNAIPRNITTVHTIITQSVSGGSSSSSSSSKSTSTSTARTASAAPRLPLTVPALAAGAVIPANREFLAVLGDQKHGTNIETPLDTMVQAFRQALGEMMGNGGRQEIVLQLDRRELGRAVVNTYNLESQRVGLRLGGVY